MNNKKKLGQFYTKNYEYILSNLYIPDNIINIIEPFTGEGDLLNFIKNKDKYIIECYDIDPKKDYIIKKDTLLDNTIIFKNKFIITNPPYLARNKCLDKIIFDKYNENDLYKCFINKIINPDELCLGGILIIPLNFWSSIRKKDILLREKFLNYYDIILLNIFEEKVFNDTTYTICSFQFELKKNIDKKIINNLNYDIYPKKLKYKTILNKNNNFMIGGEIYNLNIKKENKYIIGRLTNKNITNNNYITNIFVKCIDDNINNKIGLSYNEQLYIDETPNLSARTYATLIIEPFIDIEKQKELINNFNIYLNKERENYNSLFLSNYRESKDIARKRISFDLVYLIIKFLLN